MADGREDERAAGAAGRTHRHAADAGADDCAAVARAHAARIAGPGTRPIGMAAAGAEPVGRARTGTEPPGVAGSGTVAPRIAVTDAAAAALGAADTHALTHGQTRPRRMVEGIARDTEMEGGARGRPANDRITDTAVEDDGIAATAAQTVGIAVASAVAERIAVARAVTQNVAMTRAGTDRIAGAGAGAHHVGRPRAGNNQCARAVIVEDERLLAEIESDAAAAGDVGNAAASRNLDTDQRDGSSRGGRGPLRGRDGHLDKSEQLRRRGRKPRNGLKGRGGHARRRRPRTEGVSHAAAAAPGRTESADTKRTADAKAHANSVAATQREAQRIAAPAASAKSRAAHAVLERVTRSAPATDAIEHTNRPRPGVAGSRTGAEDVIAGRGRIARPGASTPSRADAGPSIAMPGAAPYGGARNAEGAAVASA